MVLLTRRSIAISPADNASDVKVLTLTSETWPEEGLTIEHQRKKDKLEEEKCSADEKNGEYAGNGLVLSEMPVDVLLEVLKRVEPSDLLHLACTSKTFRHFITSPSLTWIWRHSRALIPGLPDCPKDLTELQYAKLMFSQDCYFCSMKPDVLYTFWSGRIRTCKSCLRLRSKFSYGNRHYDLSYNGCAPKLYSYVPKLIVPFKKTVRTYRYIVPLRLWAFKSAIAAKNRDWLRTMVKEREVIKAHARECELWFKKRETERVEQRKSMIVDYLKAIGWEDEHSKITSPSDAPENSETVVKACRKDMTDIDLWNLKPFLDKFMQGLLDERIKFEQISRLKERLPLLEAVIDHSSLGLPPNTPFPGVADVFALPMVQDIINDASSEEFTLANVYPICGVFPEIAQQWRLEKEAELISIIRSTCGESYSFDPDTVLGLATTVFTCRACLNYSQHGVRKTFLRHPRILLHQHATALHTRLADTETNPDFRVLHDVCFNTRWNHYHTIGFDQQDMLILSDLLTRFGFDPKVTTAAEMDAEDPIFECCSDLADGRRTMRWTAVPRHKYEHDRLSAYHNHNHALVQPFNLKLLEGQEAQHVRDRIDEAKARERAKDSRMSHMMAMVCAHCRWTGDSVNLYHHLKQEHFIPHPTDSDMVPSLDVDLCDFHRLWPPRAGEFRLATS